MSKAGQRPYSFGRRQLMDGGASEVGQKQELPLSRLLYPQQLQSSAEGQGWRVDAHVQWVEQSKNCTLAP